MGRDEELAMAFAEGAAVGMAGGAGAAEPREAARLVVSFVDRRHGAPVSAATLRRLADNAHRYAHELEMIAAERRATTLMGSSGVDDPCTCENQDRCKVHGP